MIRNEKYCNELEDQITEEKSYRTLIENLYEISGKKEFATSLLPEIDAHIEKFREEIEKCSPVKFEGDFQGLVSDYLANEESKAQVNPFVVLHKFIENPDFSANYHGKIKKFIEAYLNGAGINFTCEEDTQDSIDGLNPSFLKYSFVKEFEDGPSSVTIICSEYSNEMYIFTDCFLNYPISRDDISKYGGECIEISDKKYTFDKKELGKKLEKALQKIEVEKAEILFQERFGNVEKEKLFNFALFHALLNGDNDLLNDMLSNFRPLINGYSKILIPRFVLDGEAVPCYVLYQDEFLPTFLGVSQTERDANLVNASEYYYQEVCKNSTIEINGKEYEIKYDEVPLYQLSLYFYSYLMEEAFEKNNTLYDFCEKYSSELIKTVDVNETKEENSIRLIQLIDNAFQCGLKKVLTFAEEHNIGFHSKNEKDINNLVYCCIGFLMKYTDLKANEENPASLEKRLEVFDFILEKCGDEIVNQMSNNGKEKPSYFLNRFREWRRLFRELYIEGNLKESLTNSFKKLDNTLKEEGNIAEVLLDATNEYFEANEKKEKMKRILREIVSSLTEEYYKEIYRISKSSVR